jgi:hypothetical protein
VYETDLNGCIATDRIGRVPSRVPAECGSQRQRRNGKGAVVDPNASGGRRKRRWLVAAFALIVAIAVLAAYLLSLPQFGAPLEGDRLARARANPHYRDGKFVNPLPPASYQAADLWNLVRGQFGDEIRTPPAAIPVQAVAREALQA